MYSKIGFGSIVRAADSKSSRQSRFSRLREQARSSKVEAGIGIRWKWIGIFCLRYGSEYRPQAFLALPGIDGFKTRRSAYKSMPEPSDLTRTLALQSATRLTASRTVIAGCE
jgi:hypothetical protein